MLRSTMERFAYYATPNGMKRLEEHNRKRMEEMSKNMPEGPNTYAGAADVGWGKARKDLTWVKSGMGPGGLKDKK
jgi:hypothetical protein